MFASSQVDLIIQVGRLGENDDEKFITIRIGFIAGFIATQFSATIIGDFDNDGDYVLGFCTSGDVDVGLVDTFLGATTKSVVDALTGQTNGDRELAWVNSIT